MISVHICVFGASITWGAFDTEKGGWVDRLKIYFFNQDDENYASIYNLAVSGATTGDLLKRFDIESEARRPNIVVFSIGNNDAQFLKSIGENKISIEVFQENLEKLCEKAQKFTDKIIFIGLSEVDEAKTQPVYWNADSSYSNEAIGKYDSAIESFCRDKNLKYISLKGILKTGDWEDGLHPNTRGHEKIFEVIKPEIIKVFEEVKDK